MSILDKYPPPWTPEIDGVVRAANGEIAFRACMTGPDDLDIAYDNDDAALELLSLAAPRLLRALSNIVVMVDGPEHHRRMAIDDAVALIAEIEEGGDT